MSNILRALRVRAEIATLEYEIVSKLVRTDDRLDKLMAQVEFALWKATIKVR